MKNLIATISFYVILLAVTLGSFFSGVYVANLSQDYFNFPGAWCLLNIIPLTAVGFSVEMFIILGLKKFGEK